MNLKTIPYAFFHPEEYATKVINAGVKFPAYILVIGLLLYMFPLEYLYINKELALLKAKSELLFFLLFLYKKIAGVSVMLLFTYFLQRSFIKHELKELISSKKFDENYWHRRVGFLQVFYFHQIQFFILSLFCSVKISHHLCIRNLRFCNMLYT